MILYTVSDMTSTIFEKTKQKNNQFVERILLTSSTKWINAAFEIFLGV